MCRLTASRGSCSAPPSPARQRAQEEHRREQQPLVDAERAHHLAVERGGAHQRAPARAVEEQPQGAQHHRPQHDQEQLVGRKAVAQDGDETSEARRARTQQVLRTPDGERHVLHHQHHAEGGEQLEQLGRLVDAPQEHDFNDHADDADGKRRQQHATPKANGARERHACHQRPGDVGSQHVERAVREVHDPRHAEDDGEPGRDQEQRGGAGEPVQRLDEDQVHRYPAAPRFSLPLVGRVARSAGWGEPTSAACRAIPPPLAPPHKGEGNLLRLLHRMRHRPKRKLKHSPAAASSPRRRRAGSGRRRDRPSPPSRPCRP